MHLFHKHDKVILQLIFRPFFYLILENCVFGDQVGVIVLGKTCSSLILQQSYRCYNPTIYPQCCKSCNNIATGVTGNV